MDKWNLQNDEIKYLPVFRFKKAPYGVYEGHYEFYLVFHFSEIFWKK